MKPAPFELKRPRQLAEAAELLAAHAGDARVVAGGQSLLPMMNLRAARPGVLIDLTAVPELRRSRRNDEYLEIGATVTHAMIEDDLVPDVTGGLMRAVAGRIAYRGVRNRGTIGGSVAHMYPGADWPVALLALDAEIDAFSIRGRRTLPVHEFGLGPLLTALADDEIVSAIRVRSISSGTRSAYFKFSRKTGELAHAICVIVLDSERGVARIALGGSLGAPFLLESSPLLFGVDGVTSDIAVCEAAIASSAPADAPRETLRLYAATLQRASERLDP